MKRCNTEVVSRGDAALMLRESLGAMREWGSFLQDCDRNLQDLHGFKLRPIARLKDARGHMRPVYSMTEIKTFIDTIRAIIPGAGPTPVKPIVLCINLHGGRHQRFDRHGNPMARAITGFTCRSELRKRHGMVSKLR